MPEIFKDVLERPIFYIILTICSGPKVAVILKEAAYIWCIYIQTSENDPAGMLWSVDWLIQMWLKFVHFHFDPLLWRTTYDLGSKKNPKNYKNG